MLKRPARLLYDASTGVHASAALLALTLVAATLLPGPTTPLRQTAVRAVAQPIRLIALASAPAATPSAAPTIASPDVIFSVQTARRVVALTFDLDMSPAMLADLRAGVVTSWIDRQALSLLRENKVPATLFMTGMWAETYPALARELAESGQFEIGNHSYSHVAFHVPCYGLGTLTAAGLGWEIDHTQQVIQAITGITPAYFRFPGGCLDPGVVQAVHRRGLLPIEWSLNSVDAFNPSAEQVARTIISRVRPGDIVLMHLQGGRNAPATAAALRTVLPALRAEGYRFVTLSQLLALGAALQPPGFRGVIQAPRPPPCRWVLTKQKPPQWICV
jgi:peptidoglycan-N-acetylglucosamine deacetylase